MHVSSALRTRETFRYKNGNGSNVNNTQDGNANICNQSRVVKNRGAILKKLGETTIQLKHLLIVSIEMKQQIGIGAKSGRNNN